MLKKVSTVLVLMSLFFRSFSQTPDHAQVLADMSKQLSSSYSENYKKALQLAPQKGWKLQRTTATGGIITLVGVDELGNPIYYKTFNNTIAAATTRANQLWPGGRTGLNLSGSSSSVKSKIGVWDGGNALTTHVELTGRVIIKDNTNSVADHPTHTTGTMIASGVNPIAKGMAFGAQNIQAFDFNNDASEMANAASTTTGTGLLVSNHSYGTPAGWDYDGSAWSWYGDTTLSNTDAYGFGYYDGTAQVYDSIAWNAPNYLICMSAGNSRNSAGPSVGTKYYYNGATQVVRTSSLKANPDYGSIAYTQNAKNILVVGAVNGIPLGYSSPSDVVMSDFSSWGPTDDGRIKPDVVADGVGVTSSVSTSNTAYAAMSGTSMACPNATGSLYLLQEYYYKLHPGVFMKSATLKGLAIHTADEAGTAPGPDYIFGWGLLNVEKGANVITSSYNHQTDTIIESTLVNGGTYTFTGVASGKGQLVATLSWTDPTIKAVSRSLAYNNTTKRLVDDLDMRITGAGQTYKPWILSPSFPSAAATKGDNTLDNVEKVTVDSLIPGQTYTITITHKGTLQRGSQNFSLLVSGIGGTAYCTSAPTTNAGTRIDSVSFASIHNKNVTGCTSYSNFTNLNASIQAHQTLPITVNVSSCDASTANKIVKVYIDYNGNGSFTDAGELVATSNVISGTGTFTTSIVTPGGLTIGNHTLMRIIAEETSTASDITPCGTYGKGETQDYSITFAQPSVADVALAAIINPSYTSYANPSQYLTIAVRNNIATAVSGVPVVATVKNGSTVVASYSTTLPISIPASSVGNYTFQTPFNLDSNKTYTITAYTTLANDQDNSNDTTSVSITVPATPNIAATAVTCSNQTSLNVTNPVSSTNYFWYAKPTDTIPLLIASSGTTTTIPANNTYYLAPGIRTNIPPANKLVYSSGGYNTFSGDYNIVNSAVPLTLDNARLYIGNAGRIKFVANPIAQLSSNGQFSYYPTEGDSVVLNVYPTRPTAPVLGATDNSTSDTGAIYYLGLHLDNSIGTNYLLTIYCLDGASIFRNTDITSNPYPIGMPNVFTVVRNNNSNYQGFYSFFYNTQVYTPNASTTKMPVVSTVATAPTITLSNDSLESSTSTYYQWYYNNTAISGATSQNYKPIYSGQYYVVATNVNGCATTSAKFNYVATAVTNVSADVIGLIASPNPNSGVFNVEFNSSTLSSVQIDLIDAAGRKVYTKGYGNNVGIFSTQINAGYLAAGIYILRVQLGNNVYHKTILVRK